MAKGPVKQTFNEGVTTCDIDSSLVTLAVSYGYSEVCMGLSLLNYWADLLDYSYFLHINHFPVSQQGSYEPLPMTYSYLP